MSAPSPVTPDSSAPVVTCPSCQAKASGKFCSNCGATLAASNCVACGASLRPGAKFCHRCGTPVGTEGAEPRSFSSALPWAVAAIALVALIALIAGQRFARGSQNAAPAAATDQSVAPFAGAGGANGAQPPDLSKMTPEEAAIRLYNRVMGAHERGQVDTVQMFAPMAITAYQMLGNLNADQRYDLGRIAAVSGDEKMARAEADSILAQNPTHLLGLILAGSAARMRKDLTAERAYYDKLVAAAPSERTKNLDEYTAHTNDISIALEAKRP